MGKHKKILRAEKAKVQLKKKKLPKGQNITDTSFKVKKIQIAEQLPERREGEFATIRNQTLKDLLNHLQHHNVNIQIGGLEGIKELFQAHRGLSDGLTLRQVVTRVLDLAVDDKEQKVRQAATALLGTILTPLPTDVRAPFTDLLNKQLQRGLSHINVGIQRDSLRLMDLVISLSGQGDLSTQKHLLDLLLRLLTMTGSGAPKRIAVVRRLVAISKAVFKKENAETHSITTVKWTDERSLPLTFVYHHSPRVCNGTSTLERETADELQLMIERLTGALIGVWTECSPDNVVANASVELLRLIVRLIILICQYLDAQPSDPEIVAMKKWYGGKFRKSLGKTFLSSFPFQELGETSHNKRQGDFKDRTRAAAELLTLNIDVARLYYWFKVCKPELDRKVERFISECVDMRPVSLEMFHLLQAIISMRSKQEAMVLLMIESSLKSEDSRLLDLLSTVVMDTSRDYKSHPQVWKWVVGLARNLSNASADRLKIVATLVSRGGDEALTKAVRSEIPRILFKEQPFDDTMKCKIHILYWCCTGEELLYSSKDARCSVRVRTYIEDIMRT